MVFHKSMYSEIEKICGFPCADASGARRYRKMCSRFEAAAHIGRTIRTYKKYFNIVFGIGMRSGQQLLARIATTGRNTTAQQRGSSLDDNLQTSNECERSPVYPHARHQHSRVGQRLSMPTFAGAGEGS
jgi:hypothetical protein